MQGFKPFLILSLRLYRSGLKIHAFFFLDSRFRGNDSTGRVAGEKTENLKHDRYICKILSLSSPFPCKYSRFLRNISLFLKDPCLPGRQGLKQAMAGGLKNREILRPKKTGFFQERLLRLSGFPPPPALKRTGFSKEWQSPGVSVEKGTFSGTTKLSILKRLNRRVSVL